MRRGRGHRTRARQSTPAELEENEQMSHQQYKDLLGKLQQFRNEVSLSSDVQLPQIVVVGSQSDGKSSLLQTLTNIKLPEKSGMCTKAPIVVTCSLDEKEPQDTYEIYDAERNSWATCSEDDLETKILGAQERSLSGKDKKVSKTEVQVRVRGPSQIDISIVDLPGIITNGEGQDDIKEMVRKYASSKYTLILLVTKADTDKENLPCLDLAEECDPSRCRTLRVLTKFDSFPDPDSKKRAVDVMKDGEEFDGELDLRTHATICRIEGTKYDADRESHELNKLPLPDDVLGAQRLKQRLPGILKAFLHLNLPEFKQECLRLKQQARDELQRVGEQPPDAESIYDKECRRALVRSTPRLKEKLSLYLMEFKKELKATGQNITMNFTRDMFEHDVFALSDYEGESAVEKCIEKIVEMWRPILRKYLAKVGKLLSEALAPLNQGDRIPVKFAQYVMSKWAHSSQKMHDELSYKCHEVLHQVPKPGSLNREFQYTFDDSKLDKEVDIQKLSDAFGKFLRHIIASRSLQGAEWQSAAMLNCTTGRDLDDLWARFKEHGINDILLSAPEIVTEDEKLRGVLRNTKNVWRMERIFFQMSVYKLTRDLVLEKWNTWITSDVAKMLPELTAAAVEDDSVTQRRTKAKAQIESLTRWYIEFQKLVGPTDKC